ncbi:MAG TPA: protein kinase [Blastocatellia bacterium]|nr:protein kinase [Blastocatellia bacterium]
MIGNVAGNYKILDKIGEGGMGAVYKGVDLMLEREVAVKVLRPELATQPQVVERFRAEAVTLAKLNHPNIATLHSFFRQGDNFFMVMEFVRGETLDSVLRRVGGMRVESAVPLFCQALDGIDHAHKMAIIHRDIKPANIMLTDSGSIKVMDFGIARVLGSARMTRQGNIIGTIEYMSPEQVRGQETDSRSDIYSLGILLYEMLTGRVPFTSDSEYELMKSQIEEAPIPPRDFAPHIPLPVEAAIMRALAKKPEARFPTAGEFQRALLGGISVVTMPINPAAKTEYGIGPARTEERVLQAPGEPTRQTIPVAVSQNPAAGTGDHLRRGSAGSSARPTSRDEAPPVPPAELRPNPADNSGEFNSRRYGEAALGNIAPPKETRLGSAESSGYTDGSGRSLPEGVYGQSQAGMPPGYGNTYPPTYPTGHPSDSYPSVPPSGYHTEPGYAQPVPGQPGYLPQPMQGQPANDQAAAGVGVQPGGSSILGRLNWKHYSGAAAVFVVLLSIPLVLVVHAIRRTPQRQPSQLQPIVTSSPVLPEQRATPSPIELASPSPPVDTASQTGSEAGAEDSTKPKKPVRAAPDDGTEPVGNTDAGVAPTPMAQPVQPKPVTGGQSASTDPKPVGQSRGSGGTGKGTTAAAASQQPDKKDKGKKGLFKRIGSFFKGDKKDNGKQ